MTSGKVILVQDWQEGIRQKYCGRNQAEVLLESAEGQAAGPPSEPVSSRSRARVQGGRDGAGCFLHRASGVGIDKPLAVLDSVGAV